MDEPNKFMFDCFLACKVDFKFNCEPVTSTVIALGKPFGRFFTGVVSNGYSKKVPNFDQSFSADWYSEISASNSEFFF